MNEMLRLVIMQLAGLIDGNSAVLCFIHSYLPVVFILCSFHPGILKSIGLLCPAIPATGPKTRCVFLITHKTTQNHLEQY